MQKEYKIDTSIYPENIVFSAIEDFVEVSEINFKENTLFISWENDMEIEEIFNEFINYCIWLINEQ